MFNETGSEGQFRKRKKDKEKAQVAKINELLSDDEIIGISGGLLEEEEPVHVKLKKLLHVMFFILDPTGFSTRGHASVQAVMRKLNEFTS
jgi:hypothetical protein